MSSSSIPAATLVLVRDRQFGPPELLLVQRAGRLAFAGGALVFPGGRIDSGDERLAQGSGYPDAAARVAAIRETIEESGVAVGLEPLPPRQQLLAIQAGLQAGEDFASLLERSGLRLDLGALTLFAHWHPPAGEAARRFDTLFFVARGPEGDWRPVPDNTECIAADWLTAAEALRRGEDGTALMVFPTRRNLERLAALGSYAEIVEHCRSHPVERIIPRRELRDGETWLTIPDHLGYPVTSERWTGR